MEKEDIHIFWHFCVGFQKFNNMEAEGGYLGFHIARRGHPEMHAPLTQGGLASRPVVFCFHAGETKWAKLLVSYVLLGLIYLIPLRCGFITWHFLFSFFFSLEKYNPPANLTVSYNGSHHVVRWDNPETRFDISSHILCYELDFQIKVGTLNLCEEPQIDCVLCFLPVAVEFSLRDGMLLQKVLPRWSFTLSLL